MNTVVFIASAFEQGLENSHGDITFKCFPMKYHLLTIFLMYLFFLNESTPFTDPVNV